MKREAKAPSTGESDPADLPPFDSQEGRALRAGATYRPVPFTKERQTGKCK